MILALSTCMCEWSMRTTQSINIKHEVQVNKTREQSFPTKVLTCGEFSATKLVLLQIQHSHFSWGDIEHKTANAAISAPHVSLSNIPFWCYMQSNWRFLWTDVAALIQNYIYRALYLIHSRDCVFNCTQPVTIQCISWKAWFHNHGAMYNVH